jgi:sugar lactone lactonase YvrE
MKIKLLIFIVVFNKILTTNLLFGQIITTVAGGATGHGGYWGEGGPATAAELSAPASVAVDGDGYIYIGDKERILKVNALTGIITTIAGTGILGYNGDGIPATDAQLNWAGGIIFDNSGNLIIGDAMNNRIRKINTATDTISTIAGNGILGSTGDGGPATSAEIFTGYLNWDIFGNLYMGDKRKIRKVNSSGIISTIAGTGLAGLTGDGVPATSTDMGFPNGVATDIAGNLYFANDTFGSIEKVTISTGIITRVAGTGNLIHSPYSGDGIPATTCHISPIGLNVDDTGNIYITDGVNNRIEKVDTFGIIHTLAGTGTGGFSGDGGQATSAQISVPEFVTFDACGNMYIADFNNYRIRKVTFPPRLTVPSITLTGIVTSPIGSNVTITASIINAGSSYLIHWMNHGIEFTTTTVPSVTYTKLPGIDTITAKVLPTGYGCWDSTTSAGHVVSVNTDGLASRYMGAGEVYIWPNPAYKILNIVAGGSISNVTITNLLGQIIVNEAYNSDKVQVNIAALPSGIYFVKTENNGVTTINKFVKQ